MGMTLEEYAAKHPSTQSEPDQETTAGQKTLNDRALEAEQIRQLKASISYRLSNGSAPQYILYDAVKAIGILTQDEEWTAGATSTLEWLYGDLAQLSLLANDEAIAAQRRSEQLDKYISKARTQVERQLSAARRIQETLTDSLNAINALAIESRDPAETEPK